MTRLQEAAQLRSEGRIPEAVAALRSLLDDADPHGASQAALLLGDLLERQDDLGDAADAYRRGAELGDTDLSPACEFALGVVSERAGDIEEAGAAYARALSSGHPEHSPRAGFNLGLLQQRTGRRGEALVSYRKVVASGHPEEAPKAALNLAGMLAIQVNKTEAKDLYRTVIDSGASACVPPAAVGLGALLERQGDDEGAVDAYGLAVDSADRYAASEASMRLAAMALGRGDIDEAEDRYRQAVGYRDPEIRRQAEAALTSLNEQQTAAAARGQAQGSIRLRVVSLPRNMISVLPEYFPMGFGAGPVMSMPWDSVDSTVRLRGAYDRQPLGGDPMRNAPRVDAAGGVVYFDAEESTERLTVLFGILGILRFNRDYAVVWADSDDFTRDGYLTCLRVIGRRALAQLDRDAAAGVRHQRVPAGDLLHGFVNDELRHYGPDGSGILSGALGGDGDRAYEDLAFGIMVENAYYQVYRIWSRPWLVTK